MNEQHEFGAKIIVFTILRNIGGVLGAAAIMGILGAVVGYLVASIASIFLSEYGAGLVGAIACLLTAAATGAAILELGLKYETYRYYQRK